MHIIGELADHRNHQREEGGPRGDARSGRTTAGAGQIWTEMVTPPPPTRAASCAGIRRDNASRERRLHHRRHRAGNPLATTGGGEGEGEVGAARVTLARATRGPCPVTYFVKGSFSKIVPEEFVQGLKGEIRGEIKLETRNGYSYTIGVSKNQEKLVFMAGWGQFVENFDLQMGESIIFRYNGSSQFSVVIFDKLGREKALSVIADALLPLVPERHTNATETVTRSHGRPQALQMQLPNDAMHRLHGHHQQMQMQPPAETMDHSHGHHKTKKMQSLTETVTQSQVHPQHMQMQPSSETLNRSPMQTPPVERPRQLQRNKSNQSNKTTLECSSSESSGDSFSSEEGHGIRAVSGYNYNVGEKTRMFSVQKEQLKDGYIATRGTKLTSIQEEQVKKEVQSMHSDIPIFVAVMSRTNVVSRFQLAVPNWYGQKYLGDEQSLWLQRLGENWKVSFRGRRHGLLTDRRFENGWQKFVEGNDIEIGDICLFERLNNQRCTLKVHIISAKDCS